MADGVSHGAPTLKKPHPSTGMQSYARSLVVLLSEVGPGPSADRGQGHGSGCTESRPETKGNAETADRRDSSPVSQFIPQGMQQRGRGRGGRGSSRGAGRGASWSATLRSASLLSLDRDSIATDRSHDGFEMPSYAMRNQRRKEKRRRQVVTGTGIETGSFAGAPDCNRMHPKPTSYRTCLLIITCSVSVTLCLHKNTGSNRMK